MAAVYPMVRAPPHFAGDVAESKPRTMPLVLPREAADLITGRLPPVALKCDGDVFEEPLGAIRGVVQMRGENSLVGVGVESVDAKRIQSWQALIGAQLSSENPRPT